jgi:hypothetical protein
MVFAPELKLKQRAFWHNELPFFYLNVALERLWVLQQEATSSNKASVKTADKTGG